MALPEVIPVRYSEEEAGYVSFRPIVKQSFRLNELLDMVLSVTGKDAARVRQILRSGTVVFHFYRYWWRGFDAPEDELREFLSRFPDPEPARPFHGDACVAAIFEGAGTPPKHVLELERNAASQKRFLRRRSFWDALLSAAAAGPINYHAYSYSQHADLYRLDLSEESRAALRTAAETLASRALRRDLRPITGVTRILFACPRGTS